MKTKRTPKASRVAKTRNAGTWTEAKFWAVLRSALRRAFRFWKPAQEALKAARVACKGPHGQKWAYICDICHGRFTRKEVEIHHRVAVGALRSLDDIAGFIQRLTPEGIDAFQVLCMECHKRITAEQRQAA